MTFDLDTNALRKYYPTSSWRNAYEIIKKHMRKNGFSWQEGSVYVSDKPVLDGDVVTLLRELVRENPWLNVCMRDCTLTNIGRQHSQNYLFDKNAKIPTREESKTSTMDGYRAKIAAMRSEKPKDKPDRHGHGKSKDDLDR